MDKGRWQVEAHNYRILEEDYPEVHRDSLVVDSGPNGRWIRSRVMDDLGVHGCDKHKGNFSWDYNRHISPTQLIIHLSDIKRRLKDISLVIVNLTHPCLLVCFIVQRTIQIWPHRTPVHAIVHTRRLTPSMPSHR